MIQGNGVGSSKFDTDLNAMDEDFQEIIFIVAYRRPIMEQELLRLEEVGNNGTTTSLTFWLITKLFLQGVSKQASFLLGVSKILSILLGKRTSSMCSILIVWRIKTMFKLMVHG